MEESLFKFSGECDIGDLLDQMVYRFDGMNPDPENEFAKNQKTKMERLGDKVWEEIVENFQNSRVLQKQALQQLEYVIVFMSEMPILK